MYSIAGGTLEQLNTYMEEIKEDPNWTYRDEDAIFTMKNTLNGIKADDILQKEKLPCLEHRETVQTKAEREKKD